MNNQYAEEKVFLYKVLQVAIGSFGKSLAMLSPEQRHQLEQIALRQMELEIRILGSSEACQLVIPSANTDAAIGDIAGRYSSEEEFISELENNQLSQPILRHAVNRELKVEAVMDMVASRVSEVSETDAQL